MDHPPETERTPTAATLARNWNELLQEIRVTQTGVQILTGFLLTVPFSARFDELTATQRWVYAVVLGGSVLTTGLVVAPVAFHRAMFRHRRRLLLVEQGAKLARAGLFALALTVSGVLYLSLDIVLCRTAGLAALAASLVLLIGLWFVAPPVIERRSTIPPNELPEDERIPDQRVQEQRAEGATRPD
jgi:hypothetical protein